MSSTASSPEDLLRAIVEMFATGETAEADRVFARNYIDNQGLRGETIIGPDGFRRVVVAARSAYAQLEVRIADVSIADDWVAARLVWTGVPRTGTDAEVERETVDVLRVEDGKVVEHWGSRTH